MAKSIVINYQGEEAKFSHKKINRAKLYGSRKRIPFDREGEKCLRCDLSDDGSNLILSGKRIRKRLTRIIQLLLFTGLIIVQIERTL